MADIIIPSHPYQSDTYPEEEWGWRGIIDPTLTRCGSPRDELLFNYSFDCGVIGWGFEPLYPAIITDNGDGSLHLKTESNFGSLVPEKGTYPNGTYVIEVKFRNQVGNGKISFRRPNGTWVSTPTVGDGVHQSDTFTGIISEIHVGADGDNTYEADYEYISLKKVVTQNVTYQGENVLYQGEQVVWA